MPGHEKWIKLQTRAKAGPMPTITPTLASCLAYWLREVVEPNLAPGRARPASRVAMQIVRHSQIAMTMEIYSEMPTAKARNALKRLGKELDGERCCTEMVGVGLWGDLHLRW